MSLIACSRSPFIPLKYLPPLYAALPLIFRTTTTTTTTIVRRFSTPGHTFNRLQSSVARQTPLSSVATAIIRHFNSSPIGTREFNSKATLNAKETKKITWSIQNFSSILSKNICSDQFDVGGVKWHLKAYPKGCRNHIYLGLNLEVSHNETLPYAWRIHARHLLTVLNKNSNKTVRYKALQHWYDKYSPGCGTPYILTLDQIEAKDSGFLVNDELKIVAELDVLEIIGKLKEKNSTSLVTEFIDVKGFELLPSQVKLMSQVFTKHPDFASEFRPKNPTLRASYMSFVLGIVETMCHSPQDLSKDDLSSAYAAINLLTEAGFELDWLLEKLFFQIKEKGEVCETLLKGMEEQLMGLDMNYLDVDDAIGFNWPTSLVEFLVTKERRKYRLKFWLHSFLSFTMMLFRFVYMRRD